MVPATAWHGVLLLGVAYGGVRLRPVTARGRVAFSCIIARPPSSCHTGKGPRLFLYTSSIPDIGMCRKMGLSSLVSPGPLVPLAWRLLSMAPASLRLCRTLLDSLLLPLRADREKTTPSTPSLPLMALHTSDVAFRPSAARLSTGVPFTF